MTDRRDVLLINMPWAEYLRPSMQLGLIQSLLERAGISVRSCYPNLRFAARIGIDRYRAVEDIDRATAEWIFTDAAFGDQAGDSDAYLAHVRRKGTPQRSVDAVLSLRAQVPAFLDQCMDLIAAHRPKAVGFTTAMLQTLPSVALARRIKATFPDVRVVFGGSACEGDMGPAMAKAFPVVDVVVREECDAWVGELFRRILAGQRLDDLDGIVWRDGDDVHVNPGADPFFALDENPIPEFGDYFTELGRCGLAGHFPWSVPFEGSRGCWWGEARHCRFCGLNGPTMAYRARSPDSIVHELVVQQERYQVSTFIAVDEIMPRHFFHQLPPLLEEHFDPPPTLFYEMTPATPRRSLEQLARSVTLYTQPGIESLLTPVLTAMGKGLRGIDNVCLLRRGQELHVGLLWNLLFAIPGERLSDYVGLVTELPALYHLSPPNLLPLSLERFSPFFSSPEQYGIRVTGPRAEYRYAYPLPEELLNDLCMCFDFEYLDGYDPAPTGALLLTAVKQWKQHAGEATLTASLDRGIIRISDTRQGPATHTTLDADRSLVYRLLERPRTPAAVATKLLREAPGVYMRLGGAAGVRAAIERLQRARLVWREGEFFVAVAVPTDPDFWVGLAAEEPAPEPTTLHPRVVAT